MKIDFLGCHLLPFLNNSFFNLEGHLYTARNSAQTSEKALSAGFPLAQILTYMISFMILGIVLKYLDKH